MMITATIISGLLALVSAGFAIYDTVEQEDQKKLLEEQTVNQQKYYAEVAEDVRRKGASEISKLRVAGEQKLGSLEQNASRSGVAMTGTARDIYKLSEENIEKDIETKQDDIAMQVKAAEQTGNTAYLQMQTQIYNTSANQANDVEAVVGNTLSFTKDFTSFLDMI